MACSSVDKQVQKYGSPQWGPGRRCRRLQHHAAPVYAGGRSVDGMKWTSPDEDHPSKNNVKFTPVCRGKSSKTQTMPSTSSFSFRECILWKICRGATDSQRSTYPPQIPRESSFLLVPGRVRSGQAPCRRERDLLLRGSMMRSG